MQGTHLETTTQVRFTTQDFHRMAEVGLLDSDRTYELIDGVIYQMAAESYDHASRVRRIAGQFRARVRALKLDETDIVQEGHPVVLSDYTEPEPDIAILHGDPGRTPHPEDIRLIIEVSRTTYDKDGADKLEAYAKAGIAEYWIIRIDPGQPRVLEVHQRPEGAAYRVRTTYHYGDEVSVDTWPELGTFPVDDLLG